MRKFLSNDFVTMICRLLFGGIFIYASLDKIISPDQFARIVYNYHLLPGSLVNVFALILPMSEFMAGLFLILGVFYKGSRNYLIILMIVFMIAISINIFRGVNLECGCFTVSSKAKSHGLYLILRDIVYLIPGIALMFSHSVRWMLQTPSRD
ncbi:MAG: MauE/DoxX family redox-associated membrane protein [candidate division Zixibacteria bacterium]